MNERLTTQQGCCGRAAYRILDAYTVLLLMAIVVRGNEVMLCIPMMMMYDTRAAGQV